MSLAEATFASLVGAWRLARRDPGGMACFDISVDGFWRSFFALVVMAPLFLAFALLEYRLRFAPPDLGFYLLVETLAYLLDGISFPLVMAFLSQLLGLEHGYVPFVIAYNWSSVLIMALLFVPFALTSLGILPGEVGALLTLLATIAAVYYRWYVTRVALGAPTLTAVGLVLVNVLLSTLIGVLAERIHG